MDLTVEFICCIILRNYLKGKKNSFNIDLKMYQFRLHLFSGEAPKTLSLWFSQNEIRCKRQNIRKAILEIAKQQNPDTMGKIGLASKEPKTGTKAADGDKYKDWLHRMMSSEYHFCRGYSEIEKLGKLSPEQISVRKSSIFDSLSDVEQTDLEEVADILSDMEETVDEQPRPGSSSDVMQIEEEKGPKIPAPTDWGTGQPRRSKRIRKNKFIFNL